MAWGPDRRQHLDCHQQRRDRLGDLTFTTAGASTGTNQPVSFKLLLTNWAVLGAVVESPAGSGHYQYTNFPAMTGVAKFYRVRSQ